MANERDDQYESPEEGEYHFSDDQVNYDAEPEAAPAAPQEPAKPEGWKERVIALAKQRRAMVAGAIIAVLLLVFVAYRFLSPSTPQQAEFNANVATHQAKPMASPFAVHPSTPAAEAQRAPTPPLPPTPTNQNAPGIQTIPAPPMPGSQMAQTAPTEQPAMPLPPPQAMGSQPLTLPPGVAPTSSIATQAIVERIGTLETQTSQTLGQYTQRIGTLEQQNIAMKGKLDDVSNRMSSVETSLNQLTQLLQGPVKSPPPLQNQAMQAPPGAPTMQASAGTVVSSGGWSPEGGAPQSQQPGWGMTPPPPPAGAPPPGPPPLPAQAPSFYLQAVIPGRAWLRAADGSTLTVAVGDVIKNLGRVVSIDPYNGVVRIDTGTQIITLNYGDTGESI